MIRIYADSKAEPVRCTNRDVYKRQHNTGAVRIVNDVWKRCGWLTPPQAAYKGEDVYKRQALDDASIAG